MRHSCVSAIVLLLSAPAAALAVDNTASRSFSPDAYTPDSPVTVTIVVTIAPDVSAIALEDAPPAGWVVDEGSITAYGEWDAGTGKVKWGPFFQGSIPSSVSYQVTPPEGETGEHCFVGELSYDGFLVDIAGDDCIDLYVPQLTVTASADPNAICAGASTTLRAVASFGQGPYQFLWTPGDLAGDTVIVAPTESTTYTVTVTDSLSDEATDDVGVTVVACQNGASRSFDPNTYTPESAMTVKVDITVDPYTQSASLEDAPPIDWLIDEGSISDGGAWDDGAKKVTWGPFAKGSIPGQVTYQITPPADATGQHCFAGTATFDAMPQAIEGTSCIDKTPDPLALTVRADPNVIYEGQTSTLTATVSGGVGPYSYLWSTGETADQIVVSPTETTVYSVVVTDSLTDQISGQVTVRVSDNLACRSFDQDDYEPNVPVTVTIAITTDPTTLQVGLEDAPPDGWVVDEGGISDGGVWDPVGKKVIWGPFSQGAIPDAISYPVTPPSTATGRQCFSGRATFDGVERDIVCDDCLDKAIKYTLTVALDPNACCEVTLDPPGGLYDPGTEVTVTVSAGDCCEFDRWEGDLTGSANPAVIVMDGDKTIMPICNVLGPYTLTITTQGQGSVTVDPPGLTHDCNAEVSLTPVPAQGWEFTRWEIDLTGNDVPATLVMDDDKSVRAVFTRRRFTLTVNVDPNVPCQVILDPPGGTYDYDTLVSLTVVVSGDCHVFDHWEGDLSGDANPAFITIDDHKTVTPVCPKLGPFTLTTIVDGNGTVTIDPNADAYECGASVTLTPVPAPGWQFDHWEEDLTGNTAPAILAMYADKTVRAVFAKIMYTLTVVPGPNTCCEVTADPPTGPYEAGTSVTLTVTLGECCVFERWEGDLSSDSNPVTLVMDDNKTVVPVCATLGPYTLNATVQGQGTILPIPDEDAYDCNTPVALTAVPAIGWRFGHWEQDLTGSTNPDTVVMDTNKSVRAVFELLQHTLTVDADPNTCEGVTLDPPGGTYSYGTEVTVTVELGPCGVLDYWEGSASGTDNPLIITIDGDKTIRPVCHILGPYGLTTEVRGDGRIVLEPNQGPYDCNTVISLTPEPNDGWRFDHWEGNLTGIDVPTTIRMNRDKHVTAVFVDLACPLNLAIEGQGQILLDPPGGRYREGTQVTLTAVAGEGWAFDHWEGALAGDANPVTVSTDCHRSIKAVFLPGKVLAISQQGDGQVVLDPPGGSYRYGTVVTMTADPNTGWEFDHWLGDTDGAANPATIVMDDDKIVMAVFDNQHALTVNTDPNACCQVTVEPSKPTYAFGDVVTLTVTTGECCKFERWEGDLTGDANPATITIDGSKTVTAICRQLGPYTLTANVEGQGWVTLSPPGGTYDCNTPVSLTAEPSDGWEFDRWEGDLAGDANSASLTMDDDKTVKAVFTSRFWVTIDVADTDQGSVTVTPDGPYQEGDEVRLLARPNDGWEFDRWEGDVSVGADANDPDLTVPMDGNKTLIPVFAKVQYTLTIAIVGPGRVEQSLPGKTTFEAGQTVALTGVPLQACDWFGAWEGDIDPSDPNATITLTMNSDKQILARFYDGQLSSASGCCGTAACQAGLMSLALLLLTRFGKGRPSRRRF